MNNDQRRRVHTAIDQCIFGGKSTAQFFKKGHTLTDKLTANEKGKDQLLSIIIGKGGTGKSVLLHAIVETFKFHKQGNKLANCAMSGIASAHIRGMTVHFWAGLGIHHLKTADSTNPKIIIQHKRKHTGQNVPDHS